MKLKLASAALAASMAVAPVSAEELQVFIWADYFAEDTVSNFEEETGIDVVLTYFDSVPSMETRVLTGGSGFDVVLSSASSVGRFAGAGLLEDLGNLPLENLGNLDPVIMERVKSYDGDGFYSFPYMWGTMGIVYDTAKVAELLPDADMTDLATFYSPEATAKLAECGLAIADNANEMIGIALNYLGKDPATGDKAEVNEAIALLKGIRPNLRYINSVKLIDDLATGEICAAFTYSGDAAVAAYAAYEAGNGIELAFNVPQQGTVLWVDVMNVLADAPNKDAAAKFIDYLMRPQVIADISNTVYFANANAAATELVAEEVRNNPGIYPSEEVIAKLFPELVLPNKAQRLRTRGWTAFKTGQ